MAITLGSLIRITMRGSNLAQAAYNDFDYRVDGSAFLVEPVQIAEAWWNHVKTTYRGVVGTPFTDYFQSVTIRELDDPLGDYGTYNVPIGERAGTRSGGTQSTPMPPYVAFGMQLTVGSRVTRPGQKRVGGVMEADNASGALDATSLAAWNAFGAVISASMILGAPAATIVLNPAVVGLNPDGTIRADQPVTGWLANTNLTTQNSRKFGRGI